VADSNLPSPKDFSEDASQHPISGSNYTLAPFSCIILKQCCGVIEAANDSVDDVANALEVASVAELV
jgi:hypothetical protein